MFRKLIVVICLISFAPAAVSAQVLTSIAAPSAAVVPAAEKAAPPAGELNLSLPAERSAVLMAAADTSQGTAPEQKQEARKSHSWDNFVDVHFGGYRWLWWAGAAVILGVIHAGAD